ncbi:MAG: helix-turn-helix transcriptional regulator [Dermatophilaceae bacterium]
MSEGAGSAPSDHAPQEASDDPMTEPSIAAWEYQRAAMGAFIRSQREMANMSLRQLSQATQVSNAYLSQIERGMHDPTVRVLLQIGQALHFSVEDLLRKGAEADLTGDASASNDVETAIRHDAVLSAPEKEALLAVHRSYLKSHDS